MPTTVWDLPGVQAKLSAKANYAQVLKQLKRKAAAKKAAATRRTKKVGFNPGLDLFSSTGLRNFQKEIRKELKEVKGKKLKVPRVPKAKLTAEERRLRRNEAARLRRAAKRTMMQTAKRSNPGLDLFSDDFESNALPKFASKLKRAAKSEAKAAANLRQLNAEVETLPFDAPLAIKKKVYKKAHSAGLKLGKIKYKQKNLFVDDEASEGDNDKDELEGIDWIDRYKKQIAANLKKKSKGHGKKKTSKARCPRYTVCAKKKLRTHIHEWIDEHGNKRTRVEVFPAPRSKCVRGPGFKCLLQSKPSDKVKAYYEKMKLIAPTESAYYNDPESLRYKKLAKKAYEYATPGFGQTAATAKAKQIAAQILAKQAMISAPVGQKPKHTKKTPSKLADYHVSPQKKFVKNLIKATSVAATAAKKGISPVAVVASGQLSPGSPPEIFYTPRSSASTGGEDEIFFGKPGSSAEKRAMEKTKRAIQKAKFGSPVRYAGKWSVFNDFTKGFKQGFFGTLGVAERLKNLVS